MILQALKEYYDRKAADPDSGIAPLGWEWKEIPFVFVLNEDGTLSHIEDTREPVGKTLRATSFLVPQAINRTRNPAAFLLWDKADYAFPGIAVGTDADKKHALFLQEIDRYSNLPSVRTVKAFLQKHFDAALLKDNKCWDEYVQTGKVATFRIAGHAKPVPCEEAFAREYDKTTATESSTQQTALCLVTGMHDVISQTHTKIVGVSGTDKNRGALIAFNWKAAESFGKEQGFNAPVGKIAMFAYTTALNTLLSKDSRQKMTIGDATAVFWSSRPTTLEDEFAAFFAEPPKDDPDRGTAAVERLLSSVHSGAWAADPDPARFYVLGLAPNITRISVRFWHTGTVAEISTRFADWFENLRIVHSPRDREHLSLWRLLCSIAPLGKSENIPPNLAGALVRAILEGTPYPASLLASAILRNKAERDIPYPRAKLLKAILNRNHERNLTVSLDKTNPDIGYRLGRLFAVLERIQQAANPGLNATIRDRFYSSASSTPAAVFGNLMRLKNHHLAKLAKTAYFENLLGEILDGVTTFPPHLTLPEQGMFAIGYYHQRQAFFAKKDPVPSDAAPSEPETI